MVDESATNEPVSITALSQASHEIRTPLGVAGGFLRMVMNEQVGPLNEKQKQFLSSVSDMLGQITNITAEMSELAKFDAVDEKDRIKFERAPVEVCSVLADAVARLPPMSDGRDVQIKVENQAGKACVLGDRRRLTAAVRAVLFACRRELVASTTLVVRLRRGEYNGGPALWLTVGGDHRIDDLDTVAAADLVPFVEKRGGCGLQPSMARRVIAEHHGLIWSTAPDPTADLGADPLAPESLKKNRKAEAVMVLPESSSS
jgi:two-component system OmpR family sensor kinase